MLRPRIYLDHIVPFTRDYGASRSSLFLRVLRVLTKASESLVVKKCGITLGKGRRGVEVIRTMDLLPRVLIFTGRIENLEGALKLGMFPIMIPN